MKRILIITVIAILVMLSGCGTPVASEPEEQLPQMSEQLPQMSEQLRQEIETNWYKVGYQDLSWAMDNEPAVGARYYGTYDGYAILFNDGGVWLAAETVISVGKEIFGNSTAFEIYAYRDGEFTWLPDAYEEGLISDEAVSAAAKLHRACERAYWEERFKEYHERFPDEPMPTLPYWATEPSE